MTDEELIESDESEDDGGVDLGDEYLASDGVSSKEAERRRLQAEVEAFLASGGKINQIPANVVADPPKKPESNYGGQPI
ncbi:hypothetical protein [Teredinibacter turnerae]|uniref:Transcriptional regulator SutA RNAP-binding domain-containing protein n=2 Tax=Teredinibacter turnerae TaxID=2426 RepID=C5BUL8_TERTT|nr:hypothetical protein [Teredinibacter turnerae]ACR11843.1 conserved hypothetical protein [Teredinibacter turnerae T7901]